MEEDKNLIVVVAILALALITWGTDHSVYSNLQDAVEHISEREGAG